MNIDDLFLKKDELPFRHERLFTVPIYPKLLSDNITLDPDIAKKLFPQAAEDWYEDMQTYINSPEAAEQKTWMEDVFLKGKPEVQTSDGRQTIINGMWGDLTQSLKNGFVDTLSINRNIGGSLMLPEEYGEYICSPDVNFSREKFDAYSIDDELAKGLPGTFAAIYKLDNVDEFPGALFLRNWAILYHNEALKQAWSQFT